MGHEPARDDPSLATSGSPPTASGNHFSCSISAVLLAEVAELGGEDAVGELLRLAHSPRSAEYLRDITNWISYDEAVSLWRAGSQVTHNPQLLVLGGQRAARRLSASPVAALLRSLGSPENIYRQIATGATKFSTVIRLEAIDARPGFAELIATPVEGFPRSPEHCAWTIGMLGAAPALFGLPTASVEHDQCAALGAPHCLYRISWGAERTPEDSGEELLALRHQLDGMHERLHSMFETASDLIAADEIGDILARITARAALEVRAPRYLLAVRLEPGGELHCHHRGFAEEDVERCAAQLLETDPAEHPKSWLVVPVRSDRREYGRLLAAFDADEHFFPEERELLEVYARYAATALDGAAALTEANRRYHQSSALLKLARALATAGTTGEVANRLADAVPLVVDCDRVGVYLWEPARGELVRRAIATPDGTVAELAEEDWSWTPRPGDALERLLNNPLQDPIFIDQVTGDPTLRKGLKRRGETALLIVPLATEDSLLGALAVSVRERPERLGANPDLLDRLSGVAAQATTALQNGRLVDQITHQALHDQLTGLANRLQFAEELRKAVNRARNRDELVTVFYIDLDDFKPVNDEFGHDVGDQLLSALGKRLSSCTRVSDTVARLGGDEFAVLSGTQTSSSEADSVADSVADRLADAFADPFTIDGRQLRLTASIGRAVFPIDADSADGLLRRADASMFENKRGAIGSR